MLIGRHHVKPFSSIACAGLAKLSIEISAVALDDFARLMRSDFERWTAIVETSGFTPQD
jgi:hypothetical protein